MSVPIHRDPVRYTAAQEVAYLHKLFSQDLPIVAATKRANAQIDRRIDRAQREQQRFTRKETWQIATVMFALAVGIWMCCK